MLFLKNVSIRLKSNASLRAVLFGEAIQAFKNLDCFTRKKRGFAMTSFNLDQIHYSKMISERYTQSVILTSQKIAWRSIHVGQKSKAHCWK